MCMLQITARCENLFREVIPGEAVSAELAVEDGVGPLLTDLFEEVAVDDVTISFPPTVQMELKQCAIRIRAACSCGSVAALPRQKERIMFAIEERTGLLLQELFGQVIVDSVTLSSSQDVCGSDLEYLTYL